MAATTAVPTPRPSASLYVGNLPQDITEAVLYEVFGQVGPVASARVCRDAMTRRSLGYGYVNFSSATDAERALDTLNYTPIKGRPARIMWSQRDPALRKSGLGNIFIKNLDKSIDNKSLHDTFSAFGNILSCKVMVDENGVSRGFGFVHFESPEGAELAISKVNGMLLNEKKVYVGAHISRRERSSKYEEQKKNFTNIFVKNFPETISEPEFQKIFEAHGKILSAVIMRDEAGKSKGFGFVNFTTHEEAAAACDALNETDFQGKKLFVGRAQKKAERRDELFRKHEASRQEKLNKYQGINLYVKNLDDSVDDEKLRQEFAPFGTITSSKISRDERGVSKGFGFVCYTSTEEATKALTEMNGKMVAQKPIYVALAQRKEVRRQTLEAQYQARIQLRIAQAAGALPGGPVYPPVFFPGMPPRQGGYMYPPMMPRPPRWNGPQQGPPGQNPEAYGYPGGPGGIRPPRQGPPRGARPSGPRIGGGVPTGQPPLGGDRRGYQVKAGVRNRVEQPGGVQPNPAASAQGAAQVPITGQEPLTATFLASVSPQQQKQFLGERLYVLIQEKEPELAGKITGMLLDMDNSELIHLLESGDALNAKVTEAISVLREHEAAQ